MNDLGDILKKLEPLMGRLNNNKLGSEAREDLKREMDKYLSELNKYREEISKLDEFIWKIQVEIEKQDGIEKRDEKEQSYINKIIKKTGLSRDEIEKKVKELKQERKGLISNEGALFVLAKQFGVKLEDQAKPREKQSPSRTEMEVYGRTINTETFTYTDEYVAKLEYSCRCIINTKEKLSKKITCTCEFQNFLPVLGQQFPPEHYPPGYTFHRAFAYDRRMDKEEEMDYEGMSLADYEEMLRESVKIPIFTGFTASFNVPKEVSSEEIKGAIKNWCRDLVAYWNFPQVKVDINRFIQETKPKKYPFEGWMRNLL